MCKFIELHDTEYHAILLNVDMIQYVTVNEHEETIVSINDGSFFTVVETYKEIIDMLNNIFR